MPTFPLRDSLSVMDGSALHLGHGTPMGSIRSSRLFFLGVYAGSRLRNNQRAVEKSWWQHTAPGGESSLLGPVPLDGRSPAGKAHRTTSGVSPYLRVQ